MAVVVLVLLALLVTTVMSPTGNVASSDFYTCEESDNGREDIITIGPVVRTRLSDGLKETFEDNCVNQNQLKEFYCWDDHTVRLDDRYCDCIEDTYKG